MRRIVMACAMAATTTLAHAATPGPDQLSRAVLEVAEDSAVVRDEQTLTLICEAKVDDLTVSFIGGADGKVLLAAFPPHSLSDPRLDIWLKPQMTPASDPGRSTGTQDWAYVYDKDRDGRIDHLSILYGPAPFEPASLAPAELPKFVNGEVSITSPAERELVLDSVRFAFWQLIDTGRDSYPDAIALPARRKLNGWYWGWIVLSPNEAGQTQCTSMGGAGEPLGPCAHTGVPQTYAGEAVEAQAPGPLPGRAMEVIQRGAEACRIKGKVLRS